MISCMKPTRTMEDNENVNKTTPPLGFLTKQLQIMARTLDTLLDSLYFINISS